MDNENNIKNKLGNIDKNSPFKVPDNYFDTFQLKMAERIANEEAKKQIQPVFSKPKLRLVHLVATASIVLIVISIVWIIPASKKQNLTDSELAEIYRYQAIDAASEIDLINELETLSQENEKKDSTFIQKDVLSDEAIDILSNDNIDINSIIEAL